MKNLLALLFLQAIVCGVVYAQCTPDPVYTTAGIPGIWPDTITGVASGTVGTPYSQVFTVIVPADTVVDLPAPVGQVTATINSMTITGITDLPMGLTYTCDISSCIWPGNTNGCYVIDGTPTQSGDFTFSATIVVNIEVPVLGAIDLPSYDLNYSLTIDTSGSMDTCTYTDTTYVTVYDTITYYDTVLVSVTDTLIIDVTLTGVAPPNNTNTLKVYPNPTNDVVIINNGDYSTMTNYTLKVVNDLGQEIFNSIVNAQEFQIPISTFGAEGLYYIQIFDGNNTLLDTRKLVLN